VTISYTSSDVQNLQSPFAVFKYVAASNSYVKLLSTVDPNAKTITIALDSITDPVLAIGGAKAAGAGISGALWAVLIVIVIVVVLVAVFIVSRRRPWAKIEVTDTHLRHSTSERKVDFLPEAQTSNIIVEDKPQTVIPTDQKIENQESESANTAMAQSLNLPPEPQQPEVTIEEKQPVSATEQNVDTLVKETPQPEPLNMNAQDTPQTAPPNDINVPSQNMNAGKKTQAATTRRKKNRKRNNR
jgi:cytoskeletal protein RodZ